MTTMPHRTQVQTLIPGSLPYSRMYELEEFLASQQWEQREEEAKRVLNVQLVILIHVVIAFAAMLWCPIKLF